MVKNWSKQVKALSNHGKSESLSLYQYHTIIIAYQFLKPLITTKVVANHFEGNSVSAPQPQLGDGCPNHVHKSCRIKHIGSDLSIHLALEGCDQNESMKINQNTIAVDLDEPLHYNHLHLRLLKMLWSIDMMYQMYEGTSPAKLNIAS